MSVNLLQDMPETYVGEVENYYGGLAIKVVDGQPYWGIEDHSDIRWYDCPINVFNALKEILL